jgi:hypothetical protein
MKEDRKNRILAVSRLKGISIYFEDDLYQLALLMLKLRAGRSAYEDSKSYAMPTVNGLAKRLAELVDQCYPDYDTVFAVIERHDLPLGTAIELDENVR